MKLYIIIPAVNCLNLSEGTVASIARSEIPVSYKIIFIDNESSDGTQQWGEDMQKRNEKEVKTEGIGLNAFQYIRNVPRKGVAASWNQGIKIALEDPECQYIAVLNNDIVLHPKTLKHMMAFMDKTHYLMVTGDNVNSRMSKEVLQTLELPEPFTDYDCWKIEGWRAEGPDFSCFMINPETIRVIGWFDENFAGAYCEDWDMHRRIQAARDHIQKHNDKGINPDYVHAKRLSTAPYFHYASGTIKQNPQLAKSIMDLQGKNQAYYIKKWGAIHDQAMDGVGFISPFGRADMDWTNW